MKKLLYVLSFLVLMLPALASATEITSIDSFAVTPDRLAGMVVSINQGAETGVWTYDSNSGFSGFVGTGWSIEFIGPDTGSSNFDWILTSTNTAIFDFRIDAYGDLVTGAHNFFDIATVPGNEFTPGSDAGLWFPNYPGIGPDPLAPFGIMAQIPPGDPRYQIWDHQFSYAVANDGIGLDYIWQFTDPVNLKGHPIYGDLYTTLDISFLNPLIDGTFRFAADTDVELPIPEPATLMLLGLGLLGISAAGRRKQS